MVSPLTRVPPGWIAEMALWMQRMRCPHDSTDMSGGGVPRGNVVDPHKPRP